jgi:hypothetical protein
MTTAADDDELIDKDSAADIAGEIYGLIISPALSAVKLD